MIYRFIHFNKTAGTSLQHVLRSVIHENQYLNIDELNDRDQCSARAVFMKRLLRCGFLKNYSGEDPYTFAVFRDPAERSFSDYQMLFRWLGSNELTNGEAAFDGEQASLAAYFSPKLPKRLRNRTNAYTLTLLGERYHAWFHYRLAFHDGDLSPDGLIVEEALRALKEIDLPFLFNQLSDTRILPSILSKGRIQLDPSEIVFNQHESGKDFLALSGKDRALLEYYCQVDRIIYNKITDIVASLDYEAIANRLIDEDDSIILDFQDGIALSGCYPRECNPPKYAVWSRPGGIRLAYCSRNARRKRLTFMISNYRERAFVDELVIRVGTHRIPHSFTPIEDGLLVEAWIEPDLFINNPRQEIAIITPSAPVGRSDDNRDIGIEICGLSVISAAH